MGIERRSLLAGLGALRAAASLTRSKPAATPVKLTLPWLPLGTYSFAFVARRLGYSAKRGLNVTIDRGFEGRIDGFWANAICAEIAVRRGVGTVVLDVRRDGVTPAFDYTFAALAATSRLLASRPDAIAAARRAIVAAHAALKRDVTLAEAVGRRLFPSEQAALITELVRRDLPFYSASITPHAVASLNRFAREVGLLKDDGASADILAS